MPEGDKPVPTSNGSLSGTQVTTSPEAVPRPKLKKTVSADPADVSTLLPGDEGENPDEQPQLPPHAGGFWNIPWVQNVLPLATSLGLHIGIIVLGLALYKAVQQIANPNKDQVIIPESKSIEKNAMPGGISHPGLNNDPTRDAAQDAIKNSLDDGFSSSVSNSMAAAAAGAGETESSAFEGANASAGQGTNAFNGGGGGKTARLGIPGGGGGMLPKSNFMGTGGNAAKVVYLCDASGSMLSVFGALRQKLKLSVNGLEAVDGQQFNIIFFAEDWTALWKDGMHLATNSNKEIARKFIDAQINAGATLPMQAIQFAMSQKPDLLYVLTDGFDNISSFDELTDAFKKGNVDGKIHINCIFLKSAENPMLENVLKKIAADGHGTFLPVDKNDM